jgi:type VI secretion system secreted protein VgrG
MDAALGTLNQAQQLAKSLSDAVATAQAELAQIQAQNIAGILSRICSSPRC